MLLFDPDTNWRGVDKKEHAIIAFILVAILTLFFPALTAALVALLLGIAFELGQLDTARNPDIFLRVNVTSYVPPLGRPGFGIGLLDLAADTAGIVAWLLLAGLFHLFF